MDHGSELTDAALESDIALLADVMAAAAEGDDLTPKQVDEALGVTGQDPTQDDVP